MTNYKKPYLVGISGGSASGKTLFLKSLREKFSEQELCIVSQDNYYRPPALHIKDENGEVNYDLPECIEALEFISDIEKLSRGEKVKRKEYLFQLPEGVVPRELEFSPAPVIVVEGLFIFCLEEMFRKFELRLFIEAADEIKLRRRLHRDTNERGIPEHQVRYQWTNHVLPSYRKYLLPYKDSCDVVINNNDHFNNSLQLLVNHFRTLLNANGIK
jgi:uridine kinase